MEVLVSSGPIRAATFFTLAFALTAAGGAAIGEFRIGIRWGLGLGVVFALLAYVFLRPTADPSTSTESDG